MSLAKKRLREDSGGGLQAPKLWKMLLISPEVTTNRNGLVLWLMGCWSLRGRAEMQGRGSRGCLGVGGGVGVGVCGT